MPEPEFETKETTLKHRSRNRQLFFFVPENALMLSFVKTLLIYFFFWVFGRVYMYVVKKKINST